MKIKKKLFYFFFELLPFHIWALKTCNQDISKIIIAGSFKHGHLVEDGENKKTVSYFFELLPFVNVGIENFNKDNSKHFKASSFKLCQLITG